MQVVHFYYLSLCSSTSNLVFWFVQHPEEHKPDELKLNSRTQLARITHNTSIKKINKVFGKCAALVIYKEKKGHDFTTSKTLAVGEVIWKSSCHDSTRLNKLQLCTSSVFGSIWSHFLEDLARSEKAKNYKNPEEFVYTCTIPITEESYSSKTCDIVIA